MMTCPCQYTDTEKKPPESPWGNLENQNKSNVAEEIFLTGFGIEFFLKFTNLLISWCANWLASRKKKDRMNEENVIYLVNIIQVKIHLII